MLSNELKKVARVGFSAERAHSIGLQMLRAIAFMHSKSVMHRDLKPANILISDNNVVKLCDFGEGVGRS